MINAIVCYIIIHVHTCSSKATIEVVHGLMGQVVKDQLFNLASTTQ